MKYAWIVTKDNVTEPGDGLPSRVGWTGPSTSTEEEVAKAKKGREWRTRCDEPDEKPCYYGKIWTEDEPGSEDDFGPLNDLGTPDAGCVMIEYKENGKWVEL